MKSILISWAYINWKQEEAAPKPTRLQRNPPCSTLNICHRNPPAIHEMHRSKTPPLIKWEMCKNWLWIQQALASPMHVHLCPFWPSRGLGAALWTSDRPPRCLQLCQGPQAPLLAGRPDFLVLHYLRGRGSQVWRHLCRTANPKGK